MREARNHMVAMAAEGHKVYWKHNLEVAPYECQLEPCATHYRILRQMSELLLNWPQ
jgi:hypothetical protein